MPQVLCDLADRFLLNLIDALVRDAQHRRYLTLAHALFIGVVQDARNIVAQ